MGAVMEDELSRVFAALADPTRRAILERLTRGDATVRELAEPFAMTQQAVSKHLKVLEHARLISRTRTAQSRPCVLDAVRLDAAAGWIDSQRRVWADRHDRLGAHLAALRAERHGDATHPTHPTDPMRTADPTDATRTTKTITATAAMDGPDATDPAEPRRETGEWHSDSDR